MYRHIVLAPWRIVLLKLELVLYFRIYEECIINF